MRLFVFRDRMLDSKIYNLYHIVYNLHIMYSEIIYTLILFITYTLSAYFNVFQILPILRIADKIINTIPFCLIARYRSSKADSRNVLL